jgi:hypothetical protein
VKLRIRVPASTGEADSQEVLDAANSAAAQKATAWTAPVYVDTTDGAHLFEVDAQPRMPGVSTANVAPALLPPHIV